MFGQFGVLWVIIQVGEDGSVNGDRSRGVLICQNFVDTFNAEPAGLGESTIVESQVSSFNCWRDEVTFLGAGEHTEN